jgi:hypothetical protein
METGSNLGQGEFPNVYGELTNIFNELVIQLKTSARNKGLKASGELLQSINFTPEIMAEFIRFRLNIADYYKDLDEGTKPHRVPIEKLMEWIRDKGLKPPMAKSSKKLGYKNKDAAKSFAYMIQKSIEKKGTIKRFGYKGSNFYSEVIPSAQEWVQGIKKRIAEATKKDIKVSLKTLQ